MENTQNDSPSLLRQLTGAIVGGTLAMGLYATYAYASPTLTAWLTVPQERGSASVGAVANTTENVESTARLVLRTGKIINMLGQESSSGAPQQNAVQHEPTPIEPEPVADSTEWLDPKWNDDWAVDSNEEMPEEQAHPISAMNAQAVDMAHPPMQEQIAGELPSSGLGLWLMASTALAGAVFLRRKNLRSALERTRLW
jgi:hypothetical protein